MTENAKKFLELLSSDETLAARATGKKKEELIEIAKEHGITLSAEDFEAPAQVLSDDELDAVVGGSGCACVIGGGGSKNSEFKACACVLYGQGNTKKGKMRCMCTGAGAGGGGVDLSDWVICSCGYGAWCSCVNPYDLPHSFTISIIRCVLPALTMEKPMVAAVSFYGDMTTYGISFTDASGAKRCFEISLSGVDGSVVLIECPNEHS